MGSFYGEQRGTTHLGECDSIVDDVSKMLLSRTFHERFKFLHGLIEFLERFTCRLGLYDSSFYDDVFYTNAYRVGRTKFEDDGRRVAVKRDLPYMG